jgi:acyl carrier protein
MSANFVDDGLVAALLDSICEHLSIPRGKLNADGTLETLAIDSLTFIQVIIDMERRLKRPIAPETLEKITMEMTVRDVAALLAKA